MLRILPPTSPGSPGGGGDPQSVVSATNLLRLSAGGFEAVALCAIGERIGETIYLAYLSLLGPGTTVVALWATLMDHHLAQATLEDDAGVIGYVRLWQRRPDLTDLGYRLSWRRRHTVLTRAHGARLVHLVTEPDLLTCRDPEQVESGRHSGRRRAGKGDEGKEETRSRDNKDDRWDGRKDQEGATEASGQEVAEQVARETRPLFLLLGTHNEDSHTLACRHLLFLAERIQWLAYYEPWADALWARAAQTGEASPLVVWPDEEASVQGIDGQIKEQAGHDLSPWITSAWLCRPQPLALAAALQALITGAKGDLP